MGNTKGLEQMAKELRSVTSGVALQEDGTMSPFLPGKYAALYPGGDISLGWEYDKIFPDTFKEKPGFLGRQTGHAPNHELEWGLTHTRIYISEGQIKNGALHTPISVYKTRSPIPPHEPIHIMYQLGSYLLLPRDQGELLEEGNITIFRGVGRRDFYNHPDISRFDDTTQQQWLDYISKSFLIPQVAFSVNSDCHRHQANHLYWDVRMEFNRMMTKKFGVDFEGDFNQVRNWMNQHFSVDKDTSSRKFGPYYVSMEVPLNNLRILSNWCGEGEVRIVDPKRVKNITMHRESTGRK